ncbi:hypothetical protein WJX73_006526 [Symbiochloris irregularis]|uniref:ubiquitinyl hydrolase 1 n=1 Tax=Symbiochloris irregularis TaxID=706552 RepID=A0AAW1PJ95_9CHLO
MIVSDAEYLAILGVPEPPCPDPYDKACKNRKDNPNCFCGLIPAEGSYRRKGLWQKDAEALLVLGEDPSKSKREAPDTPVGLRNLGNLCYANSALQCLFMTPPLRQGLFQVEDLLGSCDGLLQIRELFAQLQSCPYGSADPSAFVASLNLNHAIQQDSQEFFKLLLSMLENRLRQSSRQEVRELVPQLFKGMSVYETICNTCGQPSEGSRRPMGFYELDVQVRAQNTLEHALETLLGAEELAGDNQYRCESCACKRNATRQMRIRALPPHLCLSLQRFVFNMKTLTRVKAADKISFPLEMDLSGLVTPASMGGPQANGHAHHHHNNSAGEQLYDLAAILIHKGGSATSGHYVAHVREEGTGRWWRFDDESVRLMEKGPLGEHGDHGVQSTAAAEKRALHKNKRKAEAMTSSAEGPSRTSFEKEASPPQQQDAGRITSANAYMLMYRQRSSPATAGKAGGTAAASTPELPASLQTVVDQQLAQFLEQEQKYQETHEKLSNQLMDRRILVRQVILEAPVTHPDMTHRWVGGDWLRNWADSERDVPLEDSSLLCPHGALHPTSIPDAKRMSSSAWEKLHSSLPAPTPADTAPADSAPQPQGAQAETMMELLNLSEGSVHESGYYVSKTWLVAFKKRGGKTVGASPVEGICCPHGRLLPEASGNRAKRAAIPLPVWQHITHLWYSEPRSAPQQSDEGRSHHSGPAAVPAELAAFPVATSHECESCLVDLSADQAAGQDAREKREAQRSAAPQAAAATAVYLTPGTDYCLIPRAWLQGWRAYVSAGQGRRPGTADSAVMSQQQPLPLAEVMPTMMCCCPDHAPTQRLEFPPPTVSKKRGRWVTEEGDTDVWEVREMGDWRQLASLYEHTTSPHKRRALQPVRCRLVQGTRPSLTDTAHNDPSQAQGPSTSTAHDSSQAQAASSPAVTNARGKGVIEGARADEVVLGPDLKPLQGPAAATDKEAWLESDPLACATAQAQRESARQTAAMSYLDAEFWVEVVPKMANTSDPRLLFGERKSRRTRKGRAAIRVGALSTLWQVKLAITEALNVHAKNLQVYGRQGNGWKELVGDDLCLGEHGVQLGDEFRVIDTGTVDNEDLTDLCSSPNGEIERGFAGTALTGMA